MKGDLAELYALELYQESRALQRSDENGANSRRSRTAPRVARRFEELRS